MNSREIEIYNGLKAIGEELATFFADAIKIFESDFESKPYLLGHLSREIESGLRDILSPVEKEKVTVCKSCNRPIENRISHKESILKALGIESETEFSNKWHKTAKQFHSYAHRHGVWKSPREKDEFDKVWLDFVDILNKLVGNYYSVSNRLDSFLKVEKPTEEMLGSLSNLLKLESRHSYFFRNLEQKGWLEELYKNNFFSSDKNPGPREVDDKPGYYSMPYWSVLDYLEKISKENYKYNDEKISEILLKIIDAIITYKNDDGERTENYRTDYYLIKIISNLPSNKIKDEHFEFIITALKSKWDNLLAGGDFGELFLKRFIKNRERVLLLKSLKVILEYSVNNTSFSNKIESVFKYNYLGDIFKDYKSDIIKIGKIDAFNYTLTKLDEIIALDTNSFSILEIPTIEEHEQTFSPENYVCQIIYFLRDLILSLSAFNQEITVLLFLRREHSIYHRLAIYTINKNFRYYKHLRNWLSNPLEAKFCKHELYELFKAHSNQFTEDEIEQILKWTETKNYNIPADDPNYEEIIAYRKREWLSAILESNNGAVLSRFNELGKINSTNIEHPGFDIWHGSLIGSISPLTIDDIKEKDFSELIQHFHDYSKEPKSFLGPSIEGFADSLILTIRHYPEKYIIYCDSIIESESHFKYCWIRGLHESWRDENKTFEPANILKIIKVILQSDTFWDKNENPEGNNYENLFISNTISFLEDGLQNDSHAFAPLNLSIIKDILLTILNKDKSSVNDMSEYSMTVLNNTKGKIFHALFQYCLRYARLNNDLQDKWDSDIKRIIEEMLNEKIDNPLLYFVSGQFLPNIHYLNESWLIENFNKLFPKENWTNWEAAICGYLFFHPNPNQLYFKLLKDNGHYLKAIKSSLNSERSDATSHLIRHMCIAYSYCINDFSIDDEIFQILLEQKRKDYFSNMIFHYWRPKGYLDPKEKDKILPLWKLLYKQHKDLSNLELDKFIISGCTKWLIHIREFDNEVYTLVFDSVKYIDDMDKYYLIQSLDVHSKDHIEEVAKILIELFSYGVSYDISRGKIGVLVDTIYNKGFKDYGDKICIQHGEKGLDFLKNIYEKYNPS